MLSVRDILFFCSPWEFEHDVVVLFPDLDPVQSVGLEALTTSLPSSSEVGVISFGIDKVHTRLGVVVISFSLSILNLILLTN